MTMECSPGMPAAVVAEFDRLAVLIGKAATPIDSVAIEILATNIATWRKSVADVEAQGLVVMSGGIAIANPAIAVGERAQVQIRAWFDEMGLSVAIKRRMASR